MFKFNVNSLAKPKTMWSIVDQAVVSAAAFVTAAIIGRAGSAEELGLYTLGLTAVLISIDIEIALIATPFMVTYPRLAEDRRPALLGSCVIQQFALSALLAGALAAYIAFLDQTLTGQTRLVLQAVSIALFPLMLRELLRRTCFSISDFGMVLRLDIEVSCCQIFGLALLWRLGELNAATSIGVMAFAAAVPSAMWIARNRTRMRLSLVEAISHSKRGWRLGGWVLVSAILWAAGTHFLPWLLFALGDEKTVGIWGACLTVVALGRMPMTGVQNYIGPRIADEYAAGGHQAMRRYINRTAAKFGGLMSVFFVILALSGEYLVSSIFGPEFSGSGLTVSLLALSLIPAAIGFCHSRALFVLGKAQLECLVDLLPIFLMVFPGVFLISQYGAPGAAATFLVGNIGASLARWFLLARLLRKRISEAVDPIY